MTVLQLAATHPDRVAGVVMVDAAPFVYPPELRTAIETMLAAMEAGNQEPRRQFIAERMFLPTSDRRLVEYVVSVMLATPVHVAAGAMRGFLAFEGPAVVARCKVPMLNLLGTPPYNPPHFMSEWGPSVVNGWTVGAGHFIQLEAPDQVNAMIEAFLRHYL
jgi:pimeloyl-ACP methyl ester carboxylesterase